MTILSNIYTNGSLVTYQEWCSYIDTLRQNNIVNNEEEAKSLIRPAFEQAVQKRLPKKRFGILFSGGIDSTLIAFTCKKFTENFICYTVGLKGSKDIESSSKVAEKLGLTHKIKTLSLREAENVFEKTAKILGKDLINIVNLGVGSVELAAIHLAHEDSIDILFSGLGSEEIFAGYQRHEKATDINQECWNGLKSMWQRDFKRDYALATAEQVTFLTPFLDRQLIIAAMRVDANLKIHLPHKKYILRKMALKLGLTEDICFRPKSAAQYGSSVDKAISKLAKSKGFKYKKEYLSFLISST